MDSNIENKYIFRPGFINPGIKSAMTEISLVFYQFLYKFFPVIGIDAANIAASMIKVGVEKGSKSLYSNGDMRKINIAQK